MRRTVARTISTPFFKRIFAYGFSDVLSKAAPFLVLPILLKVLTPSEFGVVTNFSVIANFFFPFIMLNGHTFYAVKFHEVSATNRNNTLVTAGVVSTFLFFLLIFALYITPFSDYINTYYKFGGIWVFLGVLLAYFRSISFLLQTHLRFIEKVRLFAKLQVLDSFISAGLAILFVVVLGLGWQGRVSALITAAFLSAILLLFTYTNKIRLKDFKIKNLKEQLTFSLPLLPHSISGFGKKAAEKGLITLSFGIALNGVLASVGVFTMLIAVISNAVFSALNPEMFKILNNLYAKNKTDGQLQKQMYVKRLVRLTWFGFGLIALTIVIAYPIGYLFFNYFLDPSYASAFSYLPYILLAAFLDTLFSHFSIYLMHRKKTAILSGVTTVNIVFYILLLFFLINDMTVFQYLIVNVLFTSIKLISLIFFSHKYMPFNLKKYLDVFY